jgi:3-dehydroquinate synthase
MYLQKPKNSSYIKIKLPTQNQEIIIGSALKRWTVEELSIRGYSNFVVFVDKSIVKLYPSFLKQIKNKLSPKDFIVIDAHENSKSLGYLNSVLKKCFEMKLNRKSCMIAIGGGIVGDIVGFLSSLYMRGVDFVFMPTTLMAQGDTIINKVGISYKLLKNIIGSFYSPILTICDTDFLYTLSKKEISLGLSEIIKHALIDSVDFLNYLKKHIQPGLKNWKTYNWKEIIYKSLKIKSKFVCKDPLDEKEYCKGLSFGHTFANAIEGLSKFKVRHGDAVALGIYMSALVGKKLELLSQKEVQQQKELLERVRLSLSLPGKINKRIFIELLRRDKISSDGTITIVALRKIGKFKLFKNINPKIIISVLKSI